MNRDVEHVTTERLLVMRIGMLTPFPPAPGDLAAFAEGLCRALEDLVQRVIIVRCEDDARRSAAGPGVEGVLLHDSPASSRRAAAVLSECDVAVVHHDLGSRGASEVLDVLRDLECPSIVVLHTVPMHATGQQTDELIELCERARLVVVLSASARDRLVRTYDPIDESKVVTISRGATPATMAVPPPAVGSPLRVVSWGLMRPGKGIEQVIDAVALLDQFGHPVHYSVSGTTDHQKGDPGECRRYWEAMQARARRAGVEHLVTFDGAYRDARVLPDCIASFDAVILPYDSRDQVASGVLVDSLAAGCAVVATAFPHAVELLGGGTGMVVPHQDPRALAVALHTFMSEPEDLASLRARALSVAPDFMWPTVAHRYIDAIHSVLDRHERTSA